LIGEPADPTNNVTSRMLKSSGDFGEKLLSAKRQMVGGG
jgi:hypothetical protein